MAARDKEPAAGNAAASVKNKVKPVGIGKDSTAVGNTEEPVVGNKEPAGTHMAVAPEGPSREYLGTAAHKRQQECSTPVVGIGIVAAAGYD